MIHKWAFFFLGALGIANSTCFADKFPQSAIEISAGGQGTSWNRSQNFKIGNTSQWGDAVLNGFPGQENSLSYNRDHGGGGYQIEAAVRGKTWDYETGLRQSFVQTHEAKTEVPGTGAGLLTEMAFIDGQAHGTSRTFGYFVSAATVAGQSRPGIAALDYRLMAFEIPFYAVRSLWNRGKFRSHFFAGPVYSLFSQKLRVNTSGTNAITGGSTSSETTEKLTESLFGARLGLRGIFSLPAGFFLRFEQTSGLFVSRGRLSAEQEITQGSGNAGGGVTFSNLNETITTRDTNISQVPHFSTSVETGRHFGERVTLIFFGQFEQWLNLSRIENPIVSATLRCLVNGPALLRRDENLHAFSLGGKIVVEL